MAHMYANGAEYRKYNGMVVREPDGALIPDDPNNLDRQKYLAWLANGGIPDPKYTVEEAKAVVWKSIQSERDRRIAQGVQVGGKWFHTDQYSREQHIFLANKARWMHDSGSQLADPIPIDGQTQPWKTMDGTYTTLTVGLALDIAEAEAVMQSRLFYRAEAHKAAMEASTDPLSYDFSGGWPKGYGEP